MPQANFDNKVSQRESECVSQDAWDFQDSHGSPLDFNVTHLSINEKQDYKNSILADIIEEKIYQKDALELLTQALDDGADLNALFMPGRTFFLVLSEHADIELVLKALDYNVDINALESTYNDNALHSFLHEVYISKSGPFIADVLSVVKKMVKKGINLWHQNDNGETPLHIAVHQGQRWSEVTYYLLGEMKKDTNVSFRALPDGSGFQASFEQFIHNSDLLNNLEKFSFFIAFFEELASVQCKDIPFSSDSRTLKRDLNRKSFCYDLFTALHRTYSSEDPIHALSEVPFLKSICFDKTQVISNVQSCDEQPLYKIVLFAIRLSYSFSKENRVIFEEYFTKLVSADFNRIHETKNLSYKKYSRELEEIFESLSTFPDVVNEVADVLFFPLCMKKLFNGITANEVTEREIREIQQKARQLALKTIVENKTTLDFCRINYRWHVGGNGLPDYLRPVVFAKGLKWEKLFNDCSINETYKIVCRTSAKELTVEGDKLKHCVGQGGYTAQCYTGKTHILSIEKDGEPEATIEIEYCPFATGSEQLKLAQFYGRGNKHPTVEVEKIWESFLEKVEKQEIAFIENPGVIEEHRSQYERYNPITRITGYELEQCDEFLPEFLDHYSNRIAFTRGKNESEVKISLIEPEVFYKVMKKYL